MSARIDVVNYALAMLGQDEIVSIEDETDVARTMKALYYIARDATLESGDWTFAAKRFTPAKSSTAPDWGWASAFPIPSDVIRVTRVDRNYAWSQFPGNDLERNQVAHEIVGNEIWCNEDIIYCQGTRRMDDEGGYSPLFVEAFASKLAYLAALPITQSRTIKDDMLKMYAMTMKGAMIRDGQQNSTRRVRNKSLSQVR